MISQQTRDRADELRVSFQSARPFRHVCIDGFFADDKAEALLRDFPKFDKNLAKNEFGEYGRKAVQTRLAEVSPFYSEVYRYLLSRAFLDDMERITGIEDLISDPSMFGGGTHENLDGQELDPHIDFNYLESGEAHRRCNLLLYLNKGWDDAWGGQIELHSNPRKPEENRISAFNVTFNRAVLFETNEISWHGFPRICLPPEQADNSRKCLSVYLYTKTRPAHEIVARHGTFYVQRPLGPQFVAGHTLTEADVNEIRNAVRSRDRWIETYQKNEILQNSDIDDLIAQRRSQQEQIEELRSKSGLPLAGYALFRRIVAGIHYPDRWATPTLSMELEAIHPLSRVEIGITITEQMPALSRRFTLAVGDFRGECVLDGHGPRAFGMELGIVEGTVFTVTVTCDKSFRPSELGASLDGRELAYILNRIILE
jgi:hypothetical protein